MKRNVDLTLNRDFGANTSISEIVKLLSGSHSIHPWNMDGILNSLEDGNVLVFTGNKNDRRGKMKWVSGLSCECCGRDLSNIPWMFERGLCHICDREFIKEFVGEENFVLSSLEKTFIRERKS